MSNTIEYHLFTTPKHGESAPTLEGLTSEVYQLLTEERAAAEEKYAEAVGTHEEWKSAKAKEAHLAKLKLDKELRLEKLRVLKLEEEQKVEEKRKEDEQLCLLKEQQEAEAKQKADLKAKTDKAAMDATAKKKLRKERKERKEKAFTEVEDKGTDADTEVVVPGTLKEEALKKLKEICDGKRRVTDSMVSTADGNKKWKQPTKSASVVEESREEPSKKAKVESAGPAENEEELEGSSK